jgi:predicted metal-dependent HD superfamily phosphohydrolase
MIETQLIRNARHYAEKVLTEQLPKEFVFHNLDHTRDVVAAALEIGKASSLSDDQLETVLISAWLHDVGYLQSSTDHERNSVQTATHLLQEWGAQTEKIDAVERTILATTMPQHPKDIMGQVLCDADLRHLASSDFRETGSRLREELAKVKKITFDSDEDWLRHNRDFLKQHEYFTNYGRTVLQPLKKQNAKQVKKELKADDGKEDLEKEVEKLRKKLEKSSRPDRGIETMFRTTSENHVTLSGMADTKANIMISINTIILSIIVSVLLRKLEEFPQLLFPTLMLVITCLITIVLAILATRPNVAKGRFTREDIHNKKTNLLFFGNFHNMQLKDYEWGMKEMMKDYDYLYGSMIKDIYYLGKVLARKYKLLRLSYTVFMFGFVTSILAFIIITMLHYQPYSLQDLLKP